MDDLTATAEVLEIEPPLTRKELEEIEDVLGAYHGTLNNILYEYYSPKELGEELDRIEKLRERVRDQIA
jgi:hypothetical protein